MGRTVLLAADPALAAVVVVAETPPARERKGRPTLGLGIELELGETVCEPTASKKGREGKK